VLADEAENFARCNEDDVHQHDSEQCQRHTSAGRGVPLVHTTVLGHGHTSRLYTSVSGVYPARCWATRRNLRDWRNVLTSRTLQNANMTSGTTIDTTKYAQA